MKKHQRKFMSFMVTLMLFFSVLGILGSVSGDNEPIIPLQEFTHGVLAEEITATWCGYCPPVAEALNNIYVSNDYPFYFVALITDVNDEADQRANDDLNIPGYPTVVFDGGYITEVGSSGTAEENEARFRPDIEQCGERAAHQLEIDITAYDMGGSSIDISVDVANMESSSYSGHIKVYIVEKVSRYLNQQSDPYHMGFLDYAFDEDLSIGGNSNWEGEITWVGSEHQDSLGNDFGDIVPSNILIIASVFNDAVHMGSYPPYPNVFVAYYVDQTEAADVVPPPNYGVEIIPSFQTQTVSAGETATYTLSVVNTGDVEDVFTLILHGPYANWGTLSQTSVSLQPGLSQDVILWVEIPPETSNGNYDVYVTATSSGDPSKSFTASTTTEVFNPPEYGVLLSSPQTSMNTLPGETVVYTITVQNTGDTEDTIDITKSGEYNSWATLSHNSVFLGAGLSQDITLTVEVPLDAEPDDYPINVRGTSRGDSSEFSEITLTTVVDPYVYEIHLFPDLFGQTARPGESVVYTISVENWGNTQDTVILTKSGAYSDWGTLSDTSVVLSAGGTYDITLTVDVPFDANEGDYPINVRGTSQGNTSHYCEIHLTTTVVPYQYEVDLTCDQPSQDARPGDTVYYTIVVENQGDTTDTIDITKSGTYSGWGSLSETSVTLSEGEITDIALIVDVPSEAQGGDYQINVKGTSQGNSSVFDEITTTTTVEPYYYEVNLSCQNPNQDARPGDLIIYTIRVQNRGDTEDTIEIEKSGEYNNWGTLSHTSVTLEQGEAMDITLTVDIPSDAQGDDYSISVKGKSSNDASVYDELTVTTTVVPYHYEVELTSEEPNKTARPGESIVYTINVKNKGDITDTFEIVKSGSYSNWGNLSDIFVTLAEGGEKVITLTVDIPNDAQGGDYSIFVEGISQNDPSVSHEISIITTVIPYHYEVNLICEQSTKITRPNETVQYTISVENKGDINDIVTISKSGPYSEWATLSHTSVSLGPQNTTDITITVSVPYDALGNDYEIYVKGTSSGKPTVFDEITIITTVEPYVYDVDLEPENQDDSAKPNESAQFSIMVTNTGDLLEDITLTISGTYKSWVSLSKTTLTLNAGAFEFVTLTIAVPQAARSGDYFFKIKGIYNEDSSIYDYVDVKLSVLEIEEPFGGEEIAISDIGHFPQDPTMYDEITVTAFVTGDNIRWVKLRYYLDDYFFNPIVMKSQGDNEYSTVLGPLDEGYYEYDIQVEDNLGYTYTSELYSLIVTDELSSYNDMDDDGVVDKDDAFPEDSTQWEDSDRDGYGDNPDGNNPDEFPYDQTLWSSEQIKEEETPWYESAEFIFLVILMIVVVIVIILLLTVFKGQGGLFRRRSQTRG